MANCLKKVHYFILLLLFLRLFISAQTLPLEERIFVLSKTYESIAVYFAHWEDSQVKPEELDSLYKDLLKRAITTEGRKEFFLLMQEFLAHLKNGHTWYWDNEAVKSINPIGFSWVDLNGEWVVTKSFINELKRGDQIIRINQKNPVEYYSEYSKYINASSERARRDSGRSYLALYVPEVYTLEFMNEKNQTKAIQVDRKKLNMKREELRTEGRWIEDNEVGYIKIPSFGEFRFENEAIEFVKKFKDAHSLIFDIRSNSGGSTPGRLIDILMDRPYRFYAESTPLTIGFFKFCVEFFPQWIKEQREKYKQEPSESLKRYLIFQDYFRNSHFFWKSEYNQPEDTIYRGKIIILIDRWTGSAAEDFVVPFKDNGRALIIGEPSAGSTGQPYIYNFGNGIQIGIGTKRAYLPDGTRFEGVGIQPDIEIKTSRENLYKKTDIALERAVAEAKKKLQGIR